jgi:hypothetical protein
MTISNLANFSKQELCNFEAFVLKRAERAEFYAAPHILYTQGIKNLTFEFLENTLINKIYTIAISTIAMIFTLGYSVSWGISELKNVKSELFKISCFKEQESVKRAVFDDPHAIIDFSKPLDERVARQFFVVFAQRFQLSNIESLILRNKSALTNSVVAIVQLFANRDSIKGKSRYLILDRILKDFPVSKLEDKQRLVKAIMTWGGDEFLALLQDKFFKDLEFLTQEYLYDLIPVLLNENSQEEKRVRLKRNQTIGFLLNLDEIYQRDDICPSQYALQAALNHPVRDGDIEVVKMITAKAKKLGYELNFQGAKMTAQYLKEDLKNKMLLLLE